MFIYTKVVRFFCLLSIWMSMFAYAEEPSELETRAFQLSFIAPLGTNGWDSWNVVNKFSLNILTGYAGGVDGAEFSGLGSVLRTNMKGAQFAGLGNVVLQDTRGAQFSGIINLDLGQAKGAFFSGIANAARKDFRGVQFAGITNLNLKAAKGGSFAGILNYTGEEHDGAQVAGIANISAGNAHGLQLAGIFNYAKTLRGVQLGLINYSDSVESGTPIGFLSFVRNGYYALELSANESLYGVTSFKTGTRSFYNILSVGGGYRKNRSLFAWGWGIGTLVALAEKLDLAIEGQAFHVNEGEWFTNGTNVLSKASANLAWNLAEHLTIFAGPSFNVAVSNIKKENGSVIPPWAVFDATTAGGVNVKMYPGINAGIRI